MAMNVHFTAQMIVVFWLLLYMQEMRYALFVSVMYNISTNHRLKVRYPQLKLKLNKNQQTLLKQVLIC